VRKFPFLEFSPMGAKVIRPTYVSTPSPKNSQKE
jgi:hypothetical protein